MNYQLQNKNKTDIYAKIKEYNQRQEEQKQTIKEQKFKQAEIKQPQQSKMQQPKQQEIRNPQPQYQHPQSITEPNTLQLISTINKREWENSELKVTLAKSQETYSNLMNYTNQLLETVKSHQEQSMKQMQEKVKNIQTSNEILENAVNQKVSYLADSIRKDIVNTVSERLSSSIKNNKEMITNFSNAQLKHMERIGEGYRRNQENFLEIQGVKNTLFWIFAGSWLIWALNFIWNLILTFI